MDFVGQFDAGVRPRHIDRTIVRGLQGDPAAFVWIGLPMIRADDVLRLGNQSGGVVVHRRFASGQVVLIDESGVALAGLSHDVIRNGIVGIQTRNATELTAYIEKDLVKRFASRPSSLIAQFVCVTAKRPRVFWVYQRAVDDTLRLDRSEEHTSELQ